MKIFKSISITFLTLSLLTLSYCKTEDPVPAPKSCFTIETINPFAEDTVTFLSCSTGAVSYKWDFGDSITTSNKKDPTHVYTASGTYIVSLKVTNESGSKTTTQELIINEKVPTEMTISKIVISQWPDINPSVNQPWDPSDGPDLFFDFYKGNTKLFYTTEWKENCVNGTAYTFDVDFPLTYSDLTSTYRFDFQDSDGTGIWEAMGGLSFQPLDKHDDGVSVIQLTDADWNIAVHVTWVY